MLYAHDARTYIVFAFVVVRSKVAGERYSILIEAGLHTPHEDRLLVYRLGDLVSPKRLAMIASLVGLVSQNVSLR